MLKYFMKFIAPLLLSMLYAIIIASLICAAVGVAFGTIHSPLLMLASIFLMSIAIKFAITVAEVVTQKQAPQLTSTVAVHNDQNTPTTADSTLKIHTTFKATNVLINDNKNRTCFTQPEANTKRMLENRGFHTIFIPKPNKTVGESNPIEAKENATILAFNV